MINIMKMRLFPYFNKQVSIPTNEDHQYNIIFFSENDDFLSTYPKLGIRRQFAKRITYLPFKLPRLLVLIKDLMVYKKRLALLPILKPDKNNTFIDTSLFFSKLDSMYKKGSYKRTPVFTRAVQYLKDCSVFGGNKSILLYHVNLNKEVPLQIINRRSLILMLMAKMGNGTFPFDNVVVVVEYDGNVKYTSIYNKTSKPLSFARIFTFLKQLVPKQKDTEQKVEIEPEPESKLELEPEVQKDQIETESESILRAISKYQTKKVLTS